MATESFSWGGLAIRIVAAIALVFGTWNPDGWSYYHWAIQPILSHVGSFNPVKFLAGVLLLAAWVVFLQATRRSIGLAGAALVAAVAGGVIWLLISSKIVSATSGRGIAHVVLFGLALVLAVGMSWSHLSRRITGQSDTDVVG